MKNITRQPKTIWKKREQAIDHERCSIFGEHMLGVGKGLASATEAYNDAVGSLELRLLVTARRFAELGAASADGQIDQMLPLDVVPRQLQAPELLKVAVDGERNGEGDS